MLVIAAIGLPGYYVAVCLMDRMGRRVMQIQGFFFMFVAFAVLGLALKPLEHAPVSDTSPYPTRGIQGARPSLTPTLQPLTPPPSPQPHVCASHRSSC